MVHSQKIQLLDPTMHLLEVTVADYTDQQLEYHLPAAFDGVRTCVITVGQQAHCTLMCTIGLGDEQLLSPPSLHGSLKITVKLSGRDAQANVTVRVRTGAGQRHTLATEQLHNAPDTISNVTVRAIVEENGVHDYVSVVQLAPGSQRAQAFQQNKILLVHKSAQATSKPTLRIEHNDIKCGHGTAIGRPDKNQVIACNLRGLNDQDSLDLLVKGFLF